MKLATPGAAEGGSSAPNQAPLRQIRPFWLPGLLVILLTGCNYEVPPPIIYEASEQSKRCEEAHLKPHINIYVGSVPGESKSVVYCDFR